MESLQVLRNRLIEKILRTTNVSFLEGIDKIFTSSKIVDEEIVELSDSQIEIIKIAEEDIKYGRLISEEELDKSDEEWMS